jgi:hypothetical protein
MLKIEFHIQFTHIKIYQDFGSMCIHEKYFQEAGEYKLKYVCNNLEATKHGN